MDLMVEDENNLEELDSRPRVYELGYLLMPTISEDSIGLTYSNLKEIIVNKGGKIIFDEMPKMINLAYNMFKVIENVNTKFSSAYFGWIKFEIEAKEIEEIKKKLDLESNLIRFLIFKTVRENTIATKKFVNRDAFRKRSSFSKKAEKGENVEINKEEIDKEIDALVAN